MIHYPVVSGKSICIDLQRIADRTGVQCRDNVTFLITKSLDPFRYLLIAVSSSMNQQQLQLIDCLREENRVLREPLGQRRLRLNDDQRRRLAAKAKGSGSKLLGALSNLGHEVGGGLIVEMLARHGMEPAPERERKTTWKEFLRQH